MLSLMVLFFVRSIDCFHRDFRALNASRVVRIILCRTCVDPYYGPVSTRNFLNLRDLRALDSFPGAASVLYACKCDDMHSVHS